jgi:hypothetical protein
MIFNKHTYEASAIQIVNKMFEYDRCFQLEKLFQYNITWFLFCVNVN